MQGFPFIHFVVSIDSVCGQWKPWADCTNVHGDLTRRCPHMTEDTFSHGTVQLIIFKDFARCLLRAPSSGISGRFIIKLTVIKTFMCLIIAGVGKSNSRMRTANTWEIQSCFIFRLLLKVNIVCHIQPGLFVCSFYLPFPWIHMKCLNETENPMFVLFFLLFVFKGNLIFQILLIMSNI